MNTVSLNGQWRLSYFDEGSSDPKDPSELASFRCGRVAAEVPGNVELDLSRAGVLPADLFYGDNILKLRPYELYQWWYEREFETPEWAGKSGTELVFDGLDCFAAVWVNGKEAGTCANALIGHVFDIGGLLSPAGESNRIAVRLRSPVNAVKDRPIEPNSLADVYRRSNLWARKPAHSYGWDIMPRAVSAGIWRPVYLREKRPTEITDVFLDTDSLSKDGALLDLQVEFRTDLPLRDFRIRVSGKCGGSEFREEWPVFFTSSGFTFRVENPKLWWPKGYGEPNLYRVRTELLHGGEVLSETETTLGIRTVKLDRTDLHTQDRPGRFGFVVNGEHIFCRGSNWVPADAFHSRDAARIPEMFRQVRDMGCNILRCWGGNVYETHQFFDLCDSEGVLVWQDFSMACAMYPQQKDFQETMREEAEWVIRSLRQHPSLALWSGDNEIDSCVMYWNQFGMRRRNPEENKITREVLPEAVRLYDSNREYLPSSPYFSPAAFDYYLAHENEIRDGERLHYLPEEHYYPHGKYFKDDLEFMKKPVFMSELGCLGFPGMDSLKKYMPPEKLTLPDPADPVWRLHSTEPVPETSTGYRVEFYRKQVAKMFGKLPDSLEEFAAASQIAQAEGIKFLVEMMRQRKGETSGVIWWNIMDGCPQLSDALVDYYFNRKLAYYYLRRTHGPVTLIVGEPDSDGMEIAAVNDTLTERQGTFRVREAETGEVKLAGDFRVERSGRTVCGRLPHPTDGPALYLVDWQCGDLSGCNHYLFGRPPFDLKRYREQWLPAIASLDGSFCPEDVGR